MNYQQFTPEMRKTHTILVPNMLPIHFRLLISIFEQYGYHMELLESTSHTVVEEGLKNVHNDTCYPALLVVGQFVEALKSGKMIQIKLPCSSHRPAVAAVPRIISTCCGNAWHSNFRKSLSSL